MFYSKCHLSKGGLACCGSWGRKESDTTEQLNCTSHLYVFFGGTSVWVFSPLFDWVVYISGIELYELLVYFGN
jgi:hypothetical protein